jgi:chorismate mutase/prephenate dehydratase
MATDLQLSQLRDEVDAIDQALVRLINARAALAIRMGEIKQQRSLPLRDVERESQVIQKIQAHNQPPTIDNADLEIIFKAIMTSCLRIQSTSRSQ